MLRIIEINMYFTLAVKQRDMRCTISRCIFYSHGLIFLLCYPFDEYVKYFYSTVIIDTMKCANEACGHKLTNEPRF